MGRQKDPMALFVSLLEGRSPAEAKPILATSDRRVVQAVVRALDRVVSRKVGRKGQPSRATSPKSRGRQP